MSDCSLDFDTIKISLAGGPLVRGNELVIDNNHVELETEAPVPLTGKTLRCYLTLRNRNATPIKLVSSAGTNPQISLNAAAGTYIITFTAAELEANITPGVGYWLILDMHTTGQPLTLKTIWYAEVTFVDLPSPPITPP